MALIFGVGAAALAAVPPLGGAFTKEAVLAAAFDSGAWVGAGTVVAGLLSALYAGRLYLLGYGPGAKQSVGQAPGPVEVVALGALAGVSLLLGALWLPGGRRLLDEVATGSLARGKPWELWASLLSIALAATLLAALWRRQHLVDLGLPERIRRSVANWWGLPTAGKVVIVDPALQLSRGLAFADRSVIDAAVEISTGVFTRLSTALRSAVEPVVDGVVHLIAGGTLRTAVGSRHADDGGVDAAVEGVALGIGIVGERSRRIQTGMSHHYYTMLVIGAGVIVIATAVWR